MKLLSIVIPVYQNEGELHFTHSEICRVIKEELPEYDYEFVFVDDGSRDNSFGELKEIQAKDSKVTIIKFSRNFGQFSAINAGVRRSKGDVVAVISADLQDPPEMIARFVKEHDNNGFDIVIGARAKRSDPWLKKQTSKLYFNVMKLTNPNMPQGGFDFYMLSRKAVEAYKQLNDKIRTHHIDILWLGFKHKFVEYERRERTVGVSQYNFQKQVRGALNGILNSSIWPIRAMSFVGVIFAIMGFLYAAAIVLSYFLKKDFGLTDGLAPVLVSLWLIGGFIMIMLGLIGEYLWRIYFEAKGRPLYIVEDVYTSEGIETHEAGQQ